MRPASHRHQDPTHGCFDCKYGIIPEYKYDDLLCFFGDDISTEGECYELGHVSVQINGDFVGLLEGDAYDSVWGGRVVDPSDTCDEWTPQPS